MKIRVDKEAIIGWVILVAATIVVLAVAFGNGYREGYDNGRIAGHLDCSPLPPSLSASPTSISGASGTSGTTDGTLQLVQSQDDKVIICISVTPKPTKTPPPRNTGTSTETPTSTETATPTDTGLPTNTYTPTATSLASSTYTPTFTATTTATGTTTGTTTYSRTGTTTRTGTPTRTKTATATSGNKVPGMGANLNGGENEVPGYHYYPDAAELDYYHGKHLDLVRLPLRWERMQPTLNGPLDAQEVMNVTGVLQAAANRGMKVILDSHEAARRSYSQPPVTGNLQSLPIGCTGNRDNENCSQTCAANAPVSCPMFRDYWQRMSAAFVGKPGLYAYELNSEAHDMGNNWNAAAQYGVDGVRQNDQSAYIVICLNEWCGGSTVNSNNNGPLLALNDPSHKLIYSAHQYFNVAEGENGSYDSGYNGVNAQTGVQLITPFIQWCVSHSVRCMVGEYGVPDQDPRWWTMLSNFLDYLAQQEQAHPNTIYGATAWWDYELGTYPGSDTWLNLRPQGGDRPQMATLSAHAGIPAP